MISIAYDVFGCPYRFAIIRNGSHGYKVTVDGNFYCTAESKRDAEDEIEDYILENGLTEKNPI